MHTNAARICKYRWNNELCTITGQILALHRLIEGIKAKNVTAVLTFIDFSKAFDSIDRGKMFEILHTTKSVEDNRMLIHQQQQSEGAIT